MTEKAVFLDRDGTIIEEVYYLSRPEQVELIPGSAGALRDLREAGFKLVVVSNQSGVARGYFTGEDVEAANKRLEELLKEENVYLDAIHYCPHMDGCNCRKPNLGMVDRAANDLGLDIERSFVVGDKVTDVELAINMKAVGILVLTGFGRKQKQKLTPQSTPAYIATDLADAARWILDPETKRG